MWVIYADEFLHHDTGRYHPECPARLTAIVEALKATSWANQLQWRSPTPVSNREVISHLKKAHTQSYIDSIRRISESGGGMLDMDTPISPQSYDTALLAVSAWLDGVDQVLSDRRPAFVLARPPGHHAEKKMGMGFCLFSNAAIAAIYALEHRNIQRVAIVDWDVHHGNGTEQIIENNPNIAYCSLHQFPCYPGTGKASDRGSHNNVLNIPLAADSGFKVYNTAFETQVIPFLEHFKPDLLMVSAGYDANHADPLAGMSLHPEDFGVFTDYLLQITPQILFGLEGGYDLDALAKSVVATIERCLV